ncbi:nyctalopin [Zeugodacus cucurbitae]|uniref:nyctalopin n=1 Tax=Zeugodacus cucurbitae TaxID=28588 RepID=UPI0023D8EA44|nr:nyctalopin [Zeugodacus cucurbitae]XP_054089238.1 nyctalopin [Zeugodacus cucurbitae]XP_054089239.1 nyctalopin [Zeugodacus cucurbitae]XP_054089240.1 nyctalopin [Zeugodacus cucurbitae]XP_054089241.1 nyctalopin [Zeugodacus cucurbitae]XP_054089242.1 nyctalopin [Zeugodacus cucurbitae]XP_054089244.1 nyctalopin [Zeugodacus cucurbitae]XP_054089245.1 nyctalopin [Zeugodacus cucurbitae]
MCPLYMTGIPYQSKATTNKMGTQTVCTSPVRWTKAKATQNNKRTTTNTLSNAQNHRNQRQNRATTTTSWRTITTIMLLCTLTLLSFVTQTQAFCPSKCQCLNVDANSHAYCVDAALEDVPIQLNPETKYINLTRNRIRSLEFTLPFYMKLEVIDLSQNLIDKLGSKNFEYQNDMRTLNLSRNSVSALQKDAFKGLSNLLVLDLSYNRIEVADASAMSDLTSLIKLDLTNNNIVSLEDNCFHNMISLEILIFKNNQLLDVPSNNLQHLHALKSLDLSDNLVEYVRNDSFEGLRELVMLTLRGNVISELDLSAFEGLTALKHLNLADNNLTMVPTQQLSKLSNLTYLSLSGNRFTQLPAVAFMNLFHLRELHLNRLDHLNRIDSRAFIDNTHLQALHLSNNLQLYDIPMRLFQGNPNVLEIYMQGNSLQTLYSAQFPVDQLERLYLGDNPLQCNCSLLWLWRLVTGNFDGESNNAGGGVHVTHPQGEAAVAALGTADADAASTAAEAYVAQQKPTRVSSSSSSSSTSGYLQLDIERIGCDIWQDNVRTRRHLVAMSEGDITCPAHIVTIVCAIFTLLLVFAIGASIVFYLRFVKRRRKLLHDRSLTRSGKSIVNVHDRILQHQPLSSGGVLGMSVGGLTYPHHTLQQQGGTHHAMLPLHSHEYQQTLPAQVDKLELERYLAAQAIANEYRALKPWELPPVKDANAYSDEPEHLYEKFDHYDYPDMQTLSKSKQATLMSNNDGCNTNHSGNGVVLMGKGGAGGTAAKPHVVYV